MADPQDQPDNAPEDAPGAGPTPPAPPAPPADRAPGDKAPDKAVKKAAAKAAKKAAKKTPAKKAPAKKAPAKKAPAKKAEPGAAKAADRLRIETNGQLATGAKEAAAQAKSAVDAANNPVAGTALSPAGRSPVPLVVAIAVSLLALLLVRQLRRRGS